jgi:predicted RNase H-like nuclease
MRVRITAIPPQNDTRGARFQMNDEWHAVTIRPGAIRGNHYHLEGRKTIIVLHTDRWTFAFDEGEGTPMQTRTFEGTGAVHIELEPFSGHALRNDGASDLQVFVLGGTKSEPRTLLEPRTRIAGVDGFRRGWVAMVKDGDAIEPRICATDDELLALFHECVIVAIDIPIGLSDHGPRSCDHHARRFLRRRASTVFPAPLRPLIALRDYVEANRVSRQIQQRGISKQGFAIAAKVEQIDRILQRHHELRGRVYEVHPEVSFAMWNGGEAIAASKRTKDGLAARRKLVEEHFGPMPPVPRGVAEDDALDALAALWTAERIVAGRARELGDARADVTGLPMRIVY